MQGDTVVYAYNGPEPAAVSLERDRWLGWRIGQIRGADNAMVSARVRRDIVKRLAAQGLISRCVDRHVEFGIEDW